MLHKLLLIVATGSVLVGNAQTKNKMNQAKNPLLCDPMTGVCEVPTTTQATSKDENKTTKPLKIIYYTDPICSSCWGIEPQLRRLKLEYGHDVAIEYHMGGLLPDWSYNSGGISKPSDVAHHWDEVSRYYNMPINGDVWLEDPLPSSYPPSIAFKAAQIQSKEKAIVFLRRMREMVFLQKKNITKWEHISAAAAGAGLDVAQLKKDYEGKAKQLFTADLELGKKLGVRGFPTLIISNSKGENATVYGFRPYTDFTAALKRLYPTLQQRPYDHGSEGLFAKYPTLTTREYAELSETSIEEAQQELTKMAAAGTVKKQTNKNGDIWLSATYKQ